MSEQPPKHNLPVGYSLLTTAFKSSEFLRNPIKFMKESMNTFGDTYTTTLGVGKKIILTQDPAFINYILKENHKNYSKSKLSTDKAGALFGKGLLFSNGDYWLKQRRLIQPAFHREKIQGLYEIVIKTINEFLTTMPVGEAIDVYPVTHRLAFNIIIKSLFDIDLSPAVIQEMSDVISDLQDFVIRDINQPIRRILYPFTREKTKNLKKANRLRTIFLDIIETRRKENKAYDDLLDMLLNSRYEDTGEGMTNDQLIDEALILIFAGHETSGNALAWLLYLLANNKDAYQKLSASFEGKSIHESLQNEYLKATINEGMRMYPPAWMTDRVALSADQFGEYVYPKDTIIIPYFYGLHNHKMLWEKADQFLPDRFIEDASIAKSKNFFPFGAGPRLCIGNNFAIMEMSFFVHAFLQGFHIQPTDQVPEMRPLITLRPDKVLLHITKKV
jgi:cytochrome P450